MIALRSGQAPSTAQLSAIDGVLSAAKANPVAQRQIEGQLSQLAARIDESTSSSESDVEAGDSPADDHNGFELADLEWAYQEAKGRARVDERSRPDPGAGASDSEQPRDGKTAQRDVEPAASGAPGTVSIDADLRGSPANVLLQQSGRQQADGDPGNHTTPAPPGRGASVAAALRHEVIHAQRDFEAPQVNLSAARRATNPTQTPAGATSSNLPVRYEPARASQPPAVPESRRALVRDFFLRPAEPRPPVKRP